MPRRVEILLYEGVQGLDVSGPLEVFAGATRASPAGGGYAVRTVSPAGAPVRTSSGLLLTPDGALATGGRVDTLLVPGGDGMPAAVDAVVVDWLRGRARSARRVASVCTGAFLLAEAGLLDGREVTTHWAYAEALAGRFPAVHVQPERIFSRDGNVWTSAGVTAGMDLALALVEQDLGRDVALTVARWLVLFLRRSGGQSQFSAQLEAQCAERDVLREVQLWVADHLDADCSVPALAERAAMSPRHFARAFAAECGVTPGRYVERLRVEAARRRLEESPAGVEAIARATGFGTAETMRRAFVRSLGVAPSEYRRRFRPLVPALD